MNFEVEALRGIWGGRYKPCADCTGRIVNHAPAPYHQKWLTDIMLNENPLFLT